ncbi:MULTISPECIES: acyl carrier protein [Streptomyces]|uniref:acyl carrier protein n=1 Tax=Streptomyces TaxID=1883 RepID=UPI00163BD8FE|nr:MULTISPECIES: acyl carrier protein [Streptomyces]MBC2874348.1 acyl carrier protein [Streptomyces sp. TYQ1024]UBI40381.1 acyl carrier protein [Streptomyces mobaraensis]UKW32963.1 acyl carrier protein [Streptomyces sp. TYQ1024]
MTSLYEPIRSCMGRYFDIPTESIRPDSTMEDLGMDSLALVELMCVLKDDLGLRIPSGDDPLSLRTTFAEAVAAVEAAQRAPQSVAGPSGPSA